MNDEELKKKCTERAKIFQQAMESCHSSSLVDCIEWFADRIAELEAIVRNTKAVDESFAKLQQENAELRKEWQEQVQKANDEGYARTLQTIQLSKAKEIIKNLMVYVPVDLKEYEEAKQFLKETE